MAQVTLNIKIPMLPNYVRTESGKEFHIGELSDAELEELGFKYPETTEAKQG